MLTSVESMTNVRLLQCSVILDGNFLLIQLIFHTSACSPHTKLPSGWHVTCTHNHWANEEITKDYIEKIIVPYLIKKRAELKLLNNQHALCIFDNFKGQLTDDGLQLLVKKK